MSGNRNDEHDHEGLTCIPQRIHCVATPEGELDGEREGLQLSHFFQVLAQVAMSVTGRNNRRGSSQNENEEDQA